MTKTIKRIKEDGFKYVERYPLDTTLEIYKRPVEIIIYNPKLDKIIIKTSYAGLEEKLNGGKNA